MNRTMLTATNTLTQLQKQMDVIGHNMANLETTGFKRREATFTDLLVQQLDNQGNVANEIGRLTPNGIRQGSGARLGQIQMDTTQGSIKATNRQLDTAFTKQGQYYRVLVENQDVPEVQYTRDGAFYLSPSPGLPNQMMLVTSAGNSVLDEDNNPITINGEVRKYEIDENGRMVMMMDDGGQQTLNLGVTLVNKPQFLEQQGNNLLRLPENIAGENVVTDLDGVLRNQISIEQSALEQSNVQLSKEMTDLTSTQRSYQFQSRSINLADQMMGLINGIR